MLGLAVAFGPTRAAAATATSALGISAEVRTGCWLNVGPAYSVDIRPPAARLSQRCGQGTIETLPASPNGGIAAISLLAATPDPVLLITY